MTWVRGRVQATFTSLAVRNYRLFFVAQIVSVTGTWMQSVAQMWLVLHLTGSGVALGITAALQFAPMLVLGAWGGLIADRTDKRRLLMLTQSVAGLLALALGVLALTGLVQLWMVYLLALLLGVVQVFDNPGRQSFVTEMVGPEQVTNAVSLNSAVFTLARVIGPAAGGILIALVGTGWCFIANGLSYFPVVGALALMHVGALHRGRPVAKAKGQIKAGIQYAWRQRELRVPLLLMLVVGTLAFNFSVLVPLLARYTFHSGAGTLGAMLSFLGVGSFVGALAAASRQRPDHRLLAGASAAFGALLLAAALMPSIPLELVVLVLVGMAMVTFQATANSLLQLNSSPALRGRVMALYVMVFLGTTPIGSPLVGWVAQHFGPRWGLGLGGLAALAAGLVALGYLLRRPIQASRPGPVAPAEMQLGVSKT